MGLITEMPDVKAGPMCNAEHVADAKPCPFCGLDLLNRPAGPFQMGLAGGGVCEEPAMHYSEGCFLHGLRVSKMEVYLGWTERWNMRADTPST
ncbi:hypothetical protein NBRC116593_28760 [Sulfitobacter pacificus]